MNPNAAEPQGVAVSAKEPTGSERWTVAEASSVIGGDQRRSPQENSSSIAEARPSSRGESSSR